MGEGLGHEDDMFAIAERLGGSLWDDDDSWAFPILTAQENDEGSLKGKEVEVAPAAPAAVMKGTKRRASEAGAGDPSGDKRASEEKEGGGGGDHEQHILIERERRKKMRDMFTSLHSLIPHLPPRTDKATIVDEAIQYIMKLQQNLGTLEKRKAQTFKGKTSVTTPGHNTPSTLTPNNKFSIQSREVFLAEHGSASKAAVSFSGRPEFPTIFKTWTSPNVILNVLGKDAHINICCPAKPGLLTAICFVLEKYVLEAVSAEVSSDGGRYMCMIHARANGAAVQFPGSHFLVGEIFKQAASEIMVYIQTQCV